MSEREPGYIGSTIDASSRTGGGIVADIRQCTGRGIVDDADDQKWRLQIHLLAC